MNMNYETGVSAGNAGDIVRSAAAASRARCVIMTRRGLLAAFGTSAVALLGLSGCGVDPALGTLGVSEDGSMGTAASKGGAWGEGGILRIGMEAAYPPFNWQENEPADDNIPIENVEGAYANGYDVQIARRICDEMGLEPVAVKMEFTGLITALNSGQIDCIIAGMSDTPDRRESIDFSDAYLLEEYALLVLKSSPFASATKLSDFSGALVLGQNQTMLDEIIDQIPGVNHMTPADNTADMLARLQAGTVDAITTDVVTGKGYIASNPDLKMIEFPEGEGFKLDYSGQCVGVRKGDDDLISEVNEALKTISDEEREELLDWAVANQPSA